MVYTKTFQDFKGSLTCLAIASLMGVTITYKVANYLVMSAKPEIIQINMKINTYNTDVDYSRHSVFISAAV